MGNQATQIAKTILEKEEQKWEDSAFERNPK